MRPLFVALMGALLAMACSRGPLPAPRVEDRAALPQDVVAADLSGLLANAVELREEQLFLVTIRFQEEIGIFTKDLVSEQGTMIVDQKQYNDLQVGRPARFDEPAHFEFALRDQLSDYTLSVMSKEPASRYYAADAAGTQTEMSATQYAEALKRLPAMGKTLVTVPFAGAVRNYVFSAEHKEVATDGRAPLKHFYLTICTLDETLPTELIHLIAYPPKRHHVTIEVPEEVYRTAGDKWSAQQTDTKPLALSGYLKFLRGRVYRKWETTDPGFLSVKDAKANRQYVIPTNW